MKKYNEFKIPTTFDCGFRKVQVYYDENQIYGKSKAMGLNALGIGEIFLQTPVKDNIDDKAVLHCFYHELTHSILHSMGQVDLCSDEVFVDSFAHLFTQFMLSQKGDLLGVWEKAVAKKKAKKK